MNLNNDFILYNKKLGKGAYSTVFLGWDINSSTNVAIKNIKLKSLKKKQIDKIKKEINIIEQLNHKNICKFLHYYHKKNNFYIILEYCDMNLNTLLKKEKNLDEETTKEFMIELSDALLYLQNNYIAHRDIKPQNILLLDNSIKLTDFGLACYFNNNTNMTSMCGSPLYMAPEIINDDNGYNSKIDLWSSGIVMYQMLYGKTPFNASTHYELINKINDNKIKFPNNDFSYHCLDLLAKLLTKNPDNRISWDDFFNHPFLNEYSSFVQNSKPIPIKKI